MTRSVAVPAMAKHFGWPDRLLGDVEEKVLTIIIFIGMMMNRIV